MTKCDPNRNISPQDARLCPGAGATEIELAKHITSYGEVSKSISSHFAVGKT